MSKTKEIELSIVAPMYNEAENIQRTVSALMEAMSDFPHPWEMVFVNDGSIDDTLTLAKSIEKDTPNLRVTGYSVNQGRGKALRTGMEAARGKYVVTIDFDLSYSPDHILQIYRELASNETIDMVIGSAYMKGGAVEGVPLKRLFVSKAANLIIRNAFSSQFSTVTAVLRGYRKQALDALVLEENGKEIHLEILSKGIALGMNIKEIPATLKSRKAGSSKFRFVGSAFKHLSFSLFERPIFLFGGIGAIITIAGLLSSVYITYLRFIGELNIRPLVFLAVLLIIVGVQFLSFSVIAGQNSHLRNELFKLRSEMKQLRNKDEAPDK